MHTTDLKYDIISWITKLNDTKIITELHQWINKQVQVEISEIGIIPPRRKGSLTEGYGIWADNEPFNEHNYKDILWQPENF